MKQDWEEQPDGSRVRRANGIRIVDRTRRGEIAHLVTWVEEGGRMAVLGLDAACRAVYRTTL
jgi:hypothetical protein